MTEDSAAGRVAAFTRVWRVPGRDLIERVHADRAYELHASDLDDMGADAEHLKFILDILAITAEAELTFESAPFLWHVRNGRATFHMACSDTFAWGCADAETIEPGDLPLLRDCLTELRGAGKYEEMWLGVYFCARKRRMRPMNRWLTDMREKEGMAETVHALFCVAGPERESVWSAP